MERLLHIFSHYLITLSFDLYLVALNGRKGTDRTSGIQFDRLPVTGESIFDPHYK